MSKTFLRSDASSLDNRSNNKVARPAMLRTWATYWFRGL